MLIGEVARRCGISTRMLRHYDALGLVQPSGRTPGGYRDYSDQDVRKLFQVESLRSLGIPLRQIGHVLKTPGDTPLTLVGELIQVTKQRLAQERELLDRLVAIQESGPTGWHEVLRIVELMRSLGSASAAQRQQTVLAQSHGGPIPVRLLADALLSEPDPNVAGALRWALARSGHGIAALRTAARSADVGIRRRAVLAITEMPNEADAAAVLEEALDDTDPTVRRYAALTLGRQGMESVVPALVGLISEGERDVEAAEVLGRLARGTACGDRILSALTEALDTPTATPETRIRLAQALVEIATPGAKDTLRRLIDDHDPDIARLAAALTAQPRPGYTATLETGSKTRNHRSSTQIQPTPTRGC